MQNLQQKNPFSDEEALNNSCYLGVDDEDLIFPFNKKLTPSNDIVDAHNALKRLISFIPCAGAKWLFARGTYRFGLYEEMGSQATAKALCRDIYTFLQERKKWDSQFTSFIALFKNSNFTNELDFEKSVWNHLQIMTEEDSKYFDIDRKYSVNPEDEDFVTPYCGSGFFIVAFSPVTLRISRNFLYPTLAFNLRSQFDILRESGLLTKLRNATQKKDILLNGNVNPTLEKPFAYSFTGMQKPEKWQCPYQHPKA